MDGNQYTQPWPHDSKSHYLPLPLYTAPVCSSNAFVQNSTCVPTTISSFNGENAVNHESNGERRKPCIMYGSSHATNNTAQVLSSQFKVDKRRLSRDTSAFFATAHSQ